MIGQEYLPDNVNPDDLPKIGKDGNVVGMMTPEQYQAIEQSRLARTATGGAAPVTDPNAGAGPQGAAGAGPDNPPAGSGAQPAGAQATTTPPPAPQGGATEEDKVITVGGIQKKASEWLAEFENERGIDTTGLPPATKQGLLEDFINSKHKGAWQASNTRKSEEISRLRVESEAKAREVETKQRALGDLMTRLSEEEKRLTILAAQGLKDIDLYKEDGTLDAQKLLKYQQQESAKMRIAEIKVESERVNKDAAQAAIDRTIAESENLMATHPEFAMSEPLPLVIQKIEQYGDRSHPDYQRLLDLYDLVDYAKTRNIPLEMAYQRLSAQGGLISVRAGGASAAPQPIVVQIPSTPSGARVAATVAGKQDGAAFVDGKGAVPTRTPLMPKKTVGDSVRDASIRAAAGKGNPALEKLGY